MSLITITSRAGFETAIKRKAVLIDLNAPWCAPCRLQKPILKKIAELFGGRMVVATLNVDKHPDIVKGLEVKKIPTLIVFGNSKEIQRFVGLQPEAALTDALEKLLNRQCG